MGLGQEFTRGSQGRLEPRARVGPGAKGPECQAQGLFSRQKKKKVPEDTAGRWEGDTIQVVL
jgi:hypothetical protein